MGGLKEDIKHEFFLRHLENIIKSMQFSHLIQANNKTTHKYTIGGYVGSKYHFGVHKTTIPQLTILTPQKIDEIREKEPCFNYDNKYSEGNKCSENKLFYIE
jgi:hypothetical protein